MVESRSLEQNVAHIAPPEADPRGSLRDAVARTANATRSPAALDVGAIAERASRAYWAARQGGASSEDAEQAARDTARDLDVTRAQMRHVEAVLAASPRKGVLRDIGLRVILPGALLALLYAAYRQLGVRSSPPRGSRRRADPAEVESIGE